MQALRFAVRSKWLRSITTTMESVLTYTDNSAIENFREYLRIKTVQPTPDYGM